MLRYGADVCFSACLARVSAPPKSARFVGVHFSGGENGRTSGTRSVTAPSVVVANAIGSRALLPLVMVPRARPFHVGTRVSVLVWSDQDRCAWQTCSCPALATTKPRRCAGGFVCAGDCPHHPAASSIGLVPSPAQVPDLVSVLALQPSERWAIAKSWMQNRLGTRSGVREARGIKKLRQRRSWAGIVAGRLALFRLSLPIFSPHPRTIATSLALCQLN